MNGTGLQQQIPKLKFADKHIDRILRGQKTATTEQPDLGECVQAYCGQCGEHHWMQVK